jgi:phosphatidylglycerophosphatase A
VIDEVVGMLITLFLVPVSVTGAIIGLLLFRVFDIVKPFPAGKLEELHGGFGVMSDDAMAGIYANLVLRVLWWLAPGWIVS